MIAAAWLTAAQVALALTFVLSAAGKAFNSRQFQDGLASSGIRLTFIRPAAAAVVILEAGLALSLVIAPDDLLGVTLAIAAMTLAIFTAWLIWLYRSHSGLACGCFGSATDTIGIRSMARNIALLTLSLGGLVLSSSGTHTLLPQTSWATVAVDIGMAVILLLVISWNGVRHHLVWSLESLRFVGGQAKEASK
jgi:methylamine utilization protein MauE